MNSTDTIYITAPAHRQALCAPLVVGLQEQIHHATYAHAASTAQHAGDPPVFFCLDEVANIAPIHDLPALVSEGGGQHLHVLVCLQDLSQARTRWGETAADGFLSLFQTKLILTGIADPQTLEAISSRSANTTAASSPTPSRAPRPATTSSNPPRPPRPRASPTQPYGNAPSHPRHRNGCPPSMGYSYAGRTAGCCGSRRGTGHSPG